jgi:hydroxymethylglutaryl-CoA lyase
LLDLGVDEIDLGDTIGVAQPDDIERLYDALEGLLTPSQTTLHLHDTRGRALDCAKRALELGVRSFDSSCSGLGGCPYAQGAPGNLSTQSRVRLLREGGFESGVDPDRLDEASRVIAPVLGRRLSGPAPGAKG